MGLKPVILIPLATAWWHLQPEGMRLIGVVLNCPNQTHYEQMELLMDYGFETYKPVQLASSGDVIAQIDIRHGVKAQLMLCSIMI